MEFVITTRETLSSIIKIAIVDALLESKNFSADSIELKDRIYGIQEASQFLGIAKPTIYTKTSNGTIPHFKKGKKLYFRESELIAWIEEGKRSVSDHLKNMDDYLKNKSL